MLIATLFVARLGIRKDETGKREYIIIWQMTFAFKWNKSLKREEREKKHNEVS